jgi:tetratricopeptide (TPR) repeat protein/tRNA A-37 threonylcarbamoyl transferase component Bud32
VPPQAAPPLRGLPSREAGTVIAGRYSLQEKIGEGGMGEVWVAQQSEPVKRRVALKLIKAGMDSKAVLMRFEAERQALALMDHPNIARVLDGGLTPTGQPFFVMELVNGLPLTKFCDQARLTPRQRLELFVPICQAVQHAHQKGIVHRDLKPANILVTRIDGRPVPKVIDFGVAKAVEGKLTDESLATQFGAVVGTLEYMSPEQAGFSGEDIDTRADIYSLGVLLYELLTGLRPIDATRLKKAALTEMIRIIREEEPSKPSTRLSSEASLPSLAALRQTEPRKLMTMLRGELDWVVMKCLEKSRERRYETANGLARDVQRYLGDEPVEARPQSAGYWLGKLLRRHMGAALAAALILALLIGGIVATAWQAALAARARDLAQTNEQRALEAANAERLAREAEAEHRIKAVAAEQRATAEAATARAVSDFLQLDVLRQADVRQQVRQGAPVKGILTIREALDRAAARIGNRFWEQPLTEASIREAIARSYVSIGESKLALPHQERAYELFKASVGEDDPRTLEAKTFLADCHSVAGDVGRVMRLREEVARRWLELKGPSDPHTIESQQAVAIQFLSAGRLPEAIQIYEKLLPAIEAAPTGKDDFRITTRAGLAAAYSRAGRLRDALPLLQQVYEWFAAHRPADDPDTFHALNSLAYCYYNMGRLQEALTLNERCLKQRREKYGPAHPDTIQSLNNLALNYFQLGLRREAVPLLEEACGYKKSQSGADSPEFLLLQTNLANLYTETGKLAQAIGMLEETYRLFKTRLGPGDSSTIRAAQGLGSAYTKAARFPDAVGLLEEALGPWRDRTGDVPFAVLLAKNALGLAYIESGSPEKAVALLDETVRRATATLGKDNPLIVRLTVTLGVAQREAGRLPEAIQSLEQARAVASPRELCDLLGELAATRDRAGDLNAALELRRAALAEATRSLSADQRRAAVARAQLGTMLIRAQRPAEAEPHLLAALQVQQEELPGEWTTFRTQALLGAALLGQKRYTDAEPLLLAGYEGMKKQAGSIPPSAHCSPFDVVEELVQLYTAMGKQDQAAQWRQKRNAIRSQDKGPEKWAMTDNDLPTKTAAYDPLHEPPPPDPGPPLPERIGRYRARRLLG